MRPKIIKGGLQRHGSDTRDRLRQSPTARRRAKPSVRDRFFGTKIGSSEQVRPSASRCFELGSCLLELIDVLERSVILLQPSSLCLRWVAGLMIFVRLHQLLVILPVPHAIGGGRHDGLLCLAPLLTLC